MADTRRKNRPSKHLSRAGEHWDARSCDYCGQMCANPSDPLVSDFERTWQRCWPNLALESTRSTVRSLSNASFHPHLLPCSHPTHWPVSLEQQIPIVTTRSINLTPSEVGATISKVDGPISLRLLHTTNRRSPSMKVFKFHTPKATTATTTTTTTKRLRRSNLPRRHHTHPKACHRLSTPTAKL